MTRAVPTPAGVALVLFAAAAAAAGLLAGNNLVLLVVSVLVAVVVLEAFAGGWNLRGLEVVRRLPPEVYAGLEGRGALVVVNRRRWLATWAVEVHEEGHGSQVLPHLPTGGERALPMGWRFAARGPGRLEAIRLVSVFPFGLLRRERVIPAPATLPVYPFPRPGPHEVDQDPEGGEARIGRQVGVFGDFAGLRPYRPGDRVRAIHWPTTARTGQVMAVERTGLAGESVVVRVPPRHGPAWEDALSRACGEVLRGFDRGCAVGLELPAAAWEARHGAAWRRELLEVLARAPAPRPAAGRLP